MLGVISLLLSDVSGSPFPPKEVRVWSPRADATLMVVVVVVVVVL